MPTADAMHAGADVGHVGQLEQALHGAVFAVGPVQHRKHDVEAEAGDHRVVDVVAIRARTRRSIVSSVSSLGMRDQHRFAARPQRRGRRCTRACSMTSAAEIAVGARSAIVQRPSFSMRIGSGS